MPVDSLKQCLSSQKPVQNSYLLKFEKALNRVPLEQNERYKLSTKYLDDEVDWDAFAAMNCHQGWT